MKTTFRISLYAGTLLAALTVLSCTKDVERPEVLDQGITLTFRTSLDAGVQVKSTPTPGVDALHENLLNSVYYFLYPKDVTDAAPSVSGFKTGLNETGEYSVKIPVSTSTVINDLFASSTKCQLFAVANPPASLVSALEGTPTLAQLRSKVVLSSLTKVPQDNFTMVYDDLVDENSLSDKVAINAEVPLKHLAVKFTIGALVAPSIKYIRNGVEFNYEPKAVSVSFNNGINRTTLSGWDKAAVQDGDYFSTEYAALSLSAESSYVYIYEKVSEADEIAALPTPIDETLTEVPSAPTSESPEAIKVDGKYYKRVRLGPYLKATSTAPFYSYPMEWELNTDAEPYLMYRIDWNYQGSTEDPLPLYYKLTLGRKSITQNEWYDISAKLTIAGSLYPEEPTEIYYYMDYLVKGWKNALDDNGINTPAEIKDTRYLVVPQTEFVLNNKNEITIPFSSSHDCVIALDADYEVPDGEPAGTPDPYDGLVATKTSFYKTSGDYGEHTTVSVSSSVTTVFVDTKGQLRVHRDINNTIGNTSMDISPVVIKFRIRHSDNKDFFSDITITQYPAIWVETIQNSAGTDGRDKYGYILIDGTRNSTSGSISNAQGASGTITTNSNNTSRWFTVIHVNQFDKESNTEHFVIGDPRKTEVDNLTDMWSKLTGTPNTVATAYRKYEKANGVLSYYHPTIPARSSEYVANDPHRLFVAPAFRVCTAHARNGEDNTYPEAVLRCATYQEDGYPAGRWRLPTYAELKLFRMLSKAELIPNLFYSSGKYSYAGGMCSGTTFTDGIKADNTDMGACRCVYDEWYWSKVDSVMGWDNRNKTTFTWGDVPDNFVIPTPVP